MANAPRMPHFSRGDGLGDARSGVVDGLSATMLQRWHLPRPVEVLNFSLAGTALELPGDARTPPFPGEPLRLILRSVRRRDAVAVEVEVTDAGEEQGRLCVSCRFASSEPLRGWLEPEDWRRLNRRASFRVRPHAGLPIPLSMNVRGRRLEGRLLDVSAGGLAASFRGPLEAPLESGQRVVSWVRFPQQAREVRLPGNVVGAERWRGELRCGVVLDKSSGLGWPSLERTIVAFVMQRQREELRGSE
jgi:hypothetical protein